MTVLQRLHLHSWLPRVHPRLRLLSLGLIAFMSALILSHAPVWAQESTVTAFNPLEWLQEGFEWIQMLQKDALEWIRDQGTAGIGAFILLYIVATVAFAPGFILTLGAGFVFGVLQGSIYVFIGATLGATAAFLVGRYIARGWISKKIENNTKFASIDRAVGREGFKIVLLTRLSPVFPFNLLNYAMGLTSVSLKDYFFASIGMLPGTIMYVYFGSLAQNLAQIGTDNPSNSTLQWIINIVGLIATVAVTVFVTRIARKALEEEIA